MNGMTTCVKCESSTTETSYPAGVRRDGDSYGTTVFSCSSSTCTWSTSFQWDDASTPYYYETYNDL